MNFSLYNRTKQMMIVDDLIYAETVMDRIKGLIPYQSLHERQAMFIPECSSIHTFLMKFPIDCFFLDVKNIVVSISRNIGPYWFAFGGAGSRHVLEVASRRNAPIMIDKNDILEIKEKE